MIISGRMEQPKQYIAVDLGAESGRVFLGPASLERLRLEEIYRFSNGADEKDRTPRRDYGQGKEAAAKIKADWRIWKTL